MKKNLLTSKNKNTNKNLVIAKALLMMALTTIYL